MSNKKAHDVRTTKESGVIIFNIENGNKTTNGVHTGHGSTPEASQKAFEKACAKAKQKS